MDEAPTFLCRRECRPKFIYSVNDVTFFIPQNAVDILIAWCEIISCKVAMNVTEFVTVIPA